MLGHFLSSESKQPLLGSETGLETRHALVSFLYSFVLFSMARVVVKSTGNQMCGCQLSLQFHVAFGARAW